MTDFQRHCKLFYKFVAALKRHGMGYTSEIEPGGGVRLSFWYLGTDYKKYGCNIWRSCEYCGVREGFYVAYTNALAMLKEHDHSKFKNIKYV